MGEYPYFLSGTFKGKSSTASLEVILVISIRKFDEYPNYLKMAADLKPHLRLNTNEQKDPSVKLKFNYGFGDEDEEVDQGPKDYRPMARSFQGYLANLRSDYRTRLNERTLPSLEHILYIRITFHSQFIIDRFYQEWLDEFGLLGVHFSKFNNEILFAVADRDKFRDFLKNIDHFITTELEQDSNAKYSGKILFIKEFRLLSTDDIIQYNEAGTLMNLRLINSLPIPKETYDSIFRNLLEYLRSNNIEFNHMPESDSLEVVNARDGELVEIARNFDIVLNVTSSLATVIRPTAFNLPERSYGFTTSVDENAPIIGIIDTGISDNTPLTSIVINDGAFDATGTGAFNDNVNHGTAVAALAALGKKAYTLGYRGNIDADAKLLSIKVMDASSSYLSQRAVLDQLAAAKARYPELKIFVLTICYQAHKLVNEDYSAYAFELDKFAHENDCLICICTSNNELAVAANTRYDLAYFANEETNICTPAESMNNLIVGAAADCLRTTPFSGISLSKEFPALYSRKSHIDLPALFPPNKINKLYFRPDVIECGGDYEFDRSRTMIGAGTTASMEVLSANPAEGFYGHIGTSFSAPLAANVAAQIQKLYPGIRSQSIKALIVNAASLELIRFAAPHTSLLNKCAGNGLVQDGRSVYSDENCITLLIEDEIDPEQLRIFPINFPEYLIKEDLGKKNRILRVTATLCYSFLPVGNHQLGYCPLHIGFCFFKNQSGDQIQATEESIQSLLKSGMRWSQSARHKSKPIPYTNTQKKSFVVNVTDLVNESSTFKLGVNCRINPQLLPGTETRYQGSHMFSIAITIEETLRDDKLTGKLYSELSLCNSVENIGILDADTDATAEGTI